MVMIGLLFILILLLIGLLFEAHSFLQKYFLSEDLKAEERNLKLDLEAEDRNLNTSPADPIISDKNSTNHPDYGTNNKPETDTVSQISEMDVTNGDIKHTSITSIIVEDVTTSDDSSGS